MPVQMRLRRIVVNEAQEQYYIVLQETEGSRLFSIVIGLFEIASIERPVKKIPPQRPLTHDLLVGTIEALGGELLEIRINDLRDNTYFAQLRIKQKDDVVEIDCRPSDAIAIAVRADVPIWVEESVLENAVSES